MATINAGWKEVDRVLWEVWDPIGVNDMPEARDEYHGYIPSVYAALIRGASGEELEQILQAIETERMGLSSASDTARQATAAALRTIALSERTSQG